MSSRISTSVIALKAILILPGLCSAASYTFTDLGTLGGVQSMGYGINSIGEVVGRHEILAGLLIAGRFMPDLGRRQAFW